MTVSITLQFASQAEAAAFLAGQSGTASSGKTATAEKPKKEDAPKGPKHSLDEVKAALSEVVAAHSDAAEGKKAARALFQHTGAAKMDEIDPKHFDEVFANAKAKVAAVQAAADDM